MRSRPVQARGSRRARRSVARARHGGEQDHDRYAGSFLVGPVESAQLFELFFVRLRKLIAEQFHAVSGHLATATMHFSDSLAIVKAEVAELKSLVSDTAVEARDKVELVSRTIDRTNKQVIMTTDFIQSKVIEPARELAAIMAGFRRGLEVLVAPMPKPINQTYAEDEMFIG